MSLMPGSTDLVELDKAGALAPIDYGRVEVQWRTRTTCRKTYRTDRTVGMALYATVLGYNKDTFPNDVAAEGLGRRSGT